MQIPILLLLAVHGLWGATAEFTQSINVRRRRADEVTGGATDITGNSSDIVGGSTQSTPISYFVKFEGNVLCGASLIATDIVLTAAHCVVDGFPSQVRIAPTTTSNGIVVSVDAANSIFHPLFSGNPAIGFDVAILKLSSTVDTNTYPVVKLNDNCNVPSNGATLKTYGFGRTSSDGSTSSTLQTLDTSFIALSSTCAYVAVEASSTTGICFGDSGGPLVLPGSPDVQVGAASFVNPTCAAGNPDGFARISTYYAWIRQQVCAKSSNVGSNFDCSNTATVLINIREGFRTSVRTVAGLADGVPRFIGFDGR